MASPHWPLFDLEVRTASLTLRYPDDDLLVALLDVAAAGVHDDDFMPFEVPWTRHDPPKLHQEALRFHWACRAQASRDTFRLPLAAIVDGEVVGSSELAGDDFAVRRQFATGSWIGREYQGRGIGTEMRLATLHLGFDGFGGESAHTAFWHDNGPSAGVTHKLGYSPNGVRVLNREGVATEQQLFTMNKAQFAANRRGEVTLLGVDDALEFLDLSDASAS